MAQTGCSRCPICHNPLRPPAGHAVCGHCGVVINEHTRVWHARQSWQHLVVWYGFAGLLVGLATAYLRSLSAGESENALLPISTGLCVAALGLVTHRVLSGRVSGRFVALTQSGILVGTRGTPELIEWAEVRRVTTRERVPRIELRSTSLPVPLEDIFAGESEWSAFTDAVKAGKARADAAGAPTNAAE